MKKRTKFLTGTGLFTLCSLFVSWGIERLLFLMAHNKTEDAEDALTFLWKEQEIPYHSYGKGTPILLLHHPCMGASHKEWEKNISALSEHHTLYIPDLPGYGDSTKTKTTYTAYEYASFIHAFITQVIGQPSGVLASSTAGSFALKAYELYPKDMTKLALISPTGMETQPFATPEDTQRLSLLQMPIIGTALYLKSASKKAIKSMLQNKFFFSKESVTKELMNHYYISAHKGYENARYAHASASSRFIHVSIADSIQKLAIPFLVAWGEENQTNPPEYLEKIEELNPYGQYILFEKTRIFPHYENSTSFNTIVQDFFSNP